MMRFLIDNMMMPLLNFFYGIVPNYAISIIFVTLFLKLIFWPFNKKQFDSMQKMAAIKPLQEKLQQKYKSDPKRFQKELMELYKENGVNPLGGCLPLLIQLPFLIAIFMTLSDPVFQEVLKQPGISSAFLWISNLSAKDPFFILPVFIGVSTWMTQSTMKTDPQQAKIFAIMPFLMVFISATLPAGVLIYWGFSQVFTAMQQFYMMKFPSAEGVQIQEKKKEKKNG